LAVETQHRKKDEITFSHMIFKNKYSFKSIFLLGVTLNNKTTVLVSDTYTLNELVDKVEIDGNNIKVSKDGVYEVAL
jgi:hypothetical protein